MKFKKKVKIDYNTIIMTFYEKWFYENDYTTDDCCILKMFKCLLRTF